MKTETLRHEPTEDCDGKQAFNLRGQVAHCPECEVALCWCELSYGHDCEV